MTWWWSIDRNLLPVSWIIKYCCVWRKTNVFNNVFQFYNTTGCPLQINEIHSFLRIPTTTCWWPYTSAETCVNKYNQYMICHSDVLQGPCSRYTCDRHNGMVIYKRNKGDRMWRNCCVATRTLPTSKECWFWDVTPCSQAEIRTSSGNICFLQLRTHWRWWQQAPRKVVKVSNKPSDGAFQKTVVNTGVNWLMTRKGGGASTMGIRNFDFRRSQVRKQGKVRCNHPLIYRHTLFPLFTPIYFLFIFLSSNQ
jgi:hypothetical protein